MWLFSGPPDKPLINDSGTYYPYIAIFGEAGGIQFSSTPIYPNSTVGNVDGLTLPIYYANAPLGTTVTVTSFDFTPVEWWPYASRFDGSPIWDAATGTQLQALTN